MGAGAGRLVSLANGAVRTCGWLIGFDEIADVARIADQAPAVSPFRRLSFAVAIRLQLGAHALAIIEARDRVPPRYGRVYL